MARTETAPTATHCPYCSLQCGMNLRPVTGEESKNGDGPIPEAYLGTWSGAIDNAAGHST
ncbi:hypothetical protein, partial [Streptomyces sp. NPDC059744]|uniref:hypothetical protein n=1 Tax=Streptomyces sp. NPDC059744 TaxID=3346929 RepID=UPI00365176D0